MQLGVSDNYGDVNAGWQPIPPDPSVDERVHLRLRILNYRQIEAVFGTAAAGAASAHLSTMLRKFLGSDAVLTGDTAGEFSALLNGATLFGAQFMPHRAWQWLDDFCELATLQGFPIPGGRAHLVLAGQWHLMESGVDVDPQQQERQLPEFITCPAGALPNDRWAARYRNDMALSATLLEAVNRAIGDQRAPMACAELRELHYDWQPVCAAERPAEVLCYEMRPVFIAQNGSRQPVADHRQALERLGFAAVFDRHLIRNAIAQLESDSDVVVSVEIAATSLSSQPVWSDLLSRLHASPRVAARLVLAVSAAAGFPEIGVTGDAVRRLRRLGCCIAIHGFGVGFGGLRDLLVLQPDIVATDPLILDWPVAPARRAELLKHLVGLATAMGAIVVAAGINDGVQSQAAREAGMRWQQGQWLAARSSVRTWAIASRARSCLLPAVLGFNRPQIAAL